MTYKEAYAQIESELIDLTKGEKFDAAALMQFEHGILKVKAAILLQEKEELKTQALDFKNDLRRLSEMQNESLQLLNK